MLGPLSATMLGLLSFQATPSTYWQDEKKRRKAAEEAAAKKRAEKVRSLPFKLISKTRRHAFVSLWTGLAQRVVGESKDSEKKRKSGTALQQD